MTRSRKNPRVIVLTITLLVGAIALVAREHRPSFLRPGLRLNAYISTLDGNVSVVDLVRLRAVARVPIGPALSGLREHPTRPEVWGLSTQGGYVFVLDARSNQVAARIPVGPLPYAVEFSADGNRIYTTSSGSNTLSGHRLPITRHTGPGLYRSRTGARPHHPRWQNHSRPQSRRCHAGGSRRRHPRSARRDPSCFATRRRRHSPR